MFPWCFVRFSLSLPEAAIVINDSGSWKCVVSRRRVAYDGVQFHVACYIDIRCCVCWTNHVRCLPLMIKSALKTDRTRSDTAVGGKNVGGKFDHRGDSKKSVWQSVVIRQKHNALPVSATTRKHISGEGAKERFVNSVNRCPENDRSTALTHPVWLVHAHA